MRLPETIIASELTKLGFQRKGRRMLYIRSNDVVSLLSFERPMSILHVQFAVLPLYLPCHGFIAYSYGNRLDSLYPDLPILTKESTALETEFFCAKTIRHIEEELLPAIPVISNPEVLKEYARRRCRPLCISLNPYNRFLACSKESAIHLLLYSDLYLQDYESAEKTCERYTKFVDKHCQYLMPNLREAKKAACNQIRSMICTGEQAEIRKMLLDNIRDNECLFT